jgi:hypothetical protein
VVDFRTKFLPHVGFPKIQKEFNTLLSGTPCLIDKFLSGEVKDDTFPQGIYAITDPEDEHVVYIGKTNKNKDGIRGRVRSHAGKGRRLLKKLGVTPEVFRKYNVRALAITDASIRGAAELYGIAVHMPKGNLIALLTEGKPDFDPPAKTEDLPILH